MDDLTEIRKQLNIDQNNISTGTVISTANTTATVRLIDGVEKIAYIGDNSVSEGELVQVTIDGNLCRVSGSATLQRRAATKTIIL